MGVGGQRHATAALTPGKWRDTHCIRGWVGPRAGLDRRENSRPHRDFVYSVVLCLYFIRTCSFVWIILALLLVLLCNTNIQASGGMGFDPLTIQPAASRHTDWAIPAPLTVSQPMEDIGLHQAEYFAVRTCTVLKSKNTWMQFVYCFFSDFLAVFYVLMGGDYKTASQPVTQQRT